MPPKAKITEEMVVDAAFKIAQTEGYENINARTVSQELGCSTQPVMYHFAKIEDLKIAAYEKLDEFHTAYLMNFENADENLMLEIGLNYIRFAINEPNLFRFLFQSGYSTENSLIEMIDSPELEPVLSAMQGAMEVPIKQTKDIFLVIALFAHGYASIIANNSLEYNETVVAAHLEKAFNGAYLAAQEEMK